MVSHKNWGFHIGSFWELKQKMGKTIKILSPTSLFIQFRHFVRLLAVGSVANTSGLVHCPLYLSFILMTGELLINNVTSPAHTNDKIE